MRLLTTTAAMAAALLATGVNAQGSALPPPPADTLPAPAAQGEPLRPAGAPVPLRTEGERPEAPTVTPAQLTPAAESPSREPYKRMYPLADPYWNGGPN